MGAAGLSADGSFSPRKANAENERNETAIKPLKTHDCEKSSISWANNFSDLRPPLRSGSFRSAKAPFHFHADAVSARVVRARFAGIGATVGAG